MDICYTIIMRGLRFSLLQLVISIGLILIIAYFVIKIGENSGNNQSQSGDELNPQVTIPFQQIQVK